MMAATFMGHLMTWIAVFKMRRGLVSGPEDAEETEALYPEATYPRDEHSANTAGLYD